MTPEPQDVIKLLRRVYDHLHQLEPYCSGHHRMSKRTIALADEVDALADTLSAPSPSTRGASRISREALAKFIGNELNFDAHDLNNDPEQNVCPECLRMADAILALCGDAHEGGTEEIECEECGGRGYHVGPICCGNLTKGGECRVECAVPEQTQCDVCEGSGRVEISESEGSRGAPST